MSWNCQGIRNPLTVRRLREIRSKLSPDIMFLMETKNQDEAVLNMYRGSEYSLHFTVPPEGTGGGLALSWKSNIQLDVLFSSIF